MENKTYRKKIISSIFVLSSLAVAQTSLSTGSKFMTQETQSQWSPYARYGDYLSAQMKSLKNLSMECLLRN